MFTRSPKCSRCGYDLTVTDNHGFCPECGYSVERSMRGRPVTDLTLFGKLRESGCVPVSLLMLLTLVFALFLLCVCGAIWISLVAPID